MTGAVDEHVLADELSVVFVGREHIGGYALGTCLGGQGANDIVGLETVDLQHRNVHGVQDVFDDGHRGAYVFGRGLALRLILWEGLVAKGLAVVESHA